MFVLCDRRRVNYSGFADQLKPLRPKQGWVIPGRRYGTCMDETGYSSKEVAVAIVLSTSVQKPDTVLLFICLGSHRHTESKGSLPRTRHLLKDLTSRSVAEVAVAKIKYRQA
jgi:hypothetical protein